MDQLDLTDIYRTFHPQTMNFTFFSSAHGSFSSIDHILGHKSSLGKFKKIEITPSIFSDHNAVRYLQPYLSLLRLMAGSHLRTRQIGSERNDSRGQCWGLSFLSMAFINVYIPRLEVFFVTLCSQ